MPEKSLAASTSPGLAERKNKFALIKAIMVMTWPVMIEMGLHTFIWIFDTAMVMRLGAREATAVEYGAVVFFSFYNILGALGIGTNALVARYTGARDLNQAAKTAGQALMLSVLFTLGFALVGLSAYQYYFGWIIKDPLTVKLTEDYFFYTLVSGGFALLPLLVASGIVRGTGNTKMPMIAALVANTFNAVFDYLLIFGKFGFPALGVKGAAIATGAAQLIAFTMLICYLYSDKNILPFNTKLIFSFDKKVIRQVLKLSTPAGAEEMTHSGSRMLTTSWLTILGPVAFAANAAAIAAESFSFMLGESFAITATTLVGQNIGAGFNKEARQTGYLAAVLGTVLMSAFGVLFFAFPALVMKFFNPPDPEVLKIGILCLQVAAFEQPFIALTMVFSGALKGAGDTKGPFKVGLYTNLFVRLPLIYMVVYVWKLSITYIWWVTALQYAVSALFLFIMYRKKEWHKLTHLPAANEL